MFIIGGSLFWITGSKISGQEAQWAVPSDNLETPWGRIYVSLGSEISWWNGLDVSQGDSWWCHYVPELGQNQADATSISLILAPIWHVYHLNGQCMQGKRCNGGRVILTSMMLKLSSNALLYWKMSVNFETQFKSIYPENVLVVYEKKSLLTIWEIHPPWICIQRTNLYKLSFTNTPYYGVLPSPKSCWSLSLQHCLHYKLVTHFVHVAACKIDIVIDKFVI